MGSTVLISVICHIQYSNYYIPLQLEEELSAKIYMVKIDECLIEKEQCEDSCRNVLMKNNVPLSVYTNSTSFVGVSARVESECTCDIEDQLICLNGGM